MKTFIAVTLLTLASAAFAGGYYNPRQIDTYDPATGLYFKAVEQMVEERGLLGSKSAAGPVTVNISVFDPVSGKSRFLFPEHRPWNIQTVLFETGFRDGSVQFSEPSSPYVMNNTGLDKREPRNKVLVSLRNQEQRETVLFVADKRAGTLTRLATVPFSADRHIDVRNSKLRIVHQTGQGLRFESHDW